MVEVVVADKVVVTVDSVVVVVDVVVGGDVVVVVAVLVAVVVVLVVVVVVIVDPVHSGVSAGSVDKPESKCICGSSNSSYQPSCADEVEISASNASWTVPDEGA